jgi:hypothetical protein
MINFAARRFPEPLSLFSSSIPSSSASSYFNVIAARRQAEAVEGAQEGLEGPRRGRLGFQGTQTLGRSEDLETGEWNEIKSFNGLRPGLDDLDSWNRWKRLGHETRQKKLPNNLPDIWLTWVSFYQLSGQAEGRRKEGWSWQFLELFVERS